MLGYIITKKGNVVGMDEEGRSICGKYEAKSKSWKVWRDGMGLADEQTRSFGTRCEAEDYALSIVDRKKTATLRWWT